MKRFFLLGLALGLVVLTPAKSKADEGFRVYIGPAYSQDRPYYYREDSSRHRYYRNPDEYRWHRYYYDRDTIGVQVGQVRIWTAPSHR